METSAWRFLIFLFMTLMLSIEAKAEMVPGLIKRHSLLESRLFLSKEVNDIPILLEIQKIRGSLTQHFLNEKLSDEEVPLVFSFLFSKSHTYLEKKHPNDQARMLVSLIQERNLSLVKDILNFQTQKFEHFFLLLGENLQSIKKGSNNVALTQILEKIQQKALNSKNISVRQLAKFSMNPWKLYVFQDQIDLALNENSDLSGRMEDDAAQTWKKIQVKARETLKFAAKRYLDAQDSLEGNTTHSLHVSDIQILHPDLGEKDSQIVTLKSLKKNWAILKRNANTWESSELRFYVAASESLTIGGPFKSLGRIEKMSLIINHNAPGSSVEIGKLRDIDFADIRLNKVQEAGHPDLKWQTFTDETYLKLFDQIDHFTIDTYEKMKFYASIKTSQGVYEFETLNIDTPDDRNQLKKRIKKYIPKELWSNRCFGSVRRVFSKLKQK